MILIRSALLFLLSSPSRPTCVEPEESVHVAAILLQCLGPELKVCLPCVRDGVHPACRSTLSRLPFGLDDTVFFHLPQSTVHSSRVHRLKAECSRLLHELVAVRVPLPQRQQDHRL